MKIWKTAVVIGCLLLLVYNLYNLNYRDFSDPNNYPGYLGATSAAGVILLMGVLNGVEKLKKPGKKRGAAH